MVLRRPASDEANDSGSNQDQDSGTESVHAKHFMVMITREQASIDLALGPTKKGETFPARMLVNMDHHNQVCNILQRRCPQWEDSFGDDGLRRCIGRGWHLFGTDVGMEYWLSDLNNLPFLEMMHYAQSDSEYHKRTTAIYACNKDAKE